MPGNGRRRLILRFNLTVKLALAVVTSFSAFVALFGYLALQEHRQHSEELVLQSADRVTDLIQRSTRYQMLHNDREALYEMIKAIGTERGIRVVRIFNEEGRISFSTNPREMDRVVDKRAEACYMCHSQEAPLTRLDRPDRARIFQDESGNRVLAMIRPIENEESCSTAACHYHPPERRILGVIDAHLSLADADTQLASFGRNMALLIGLAVVFGSLVAVGFIFLVVYRPVHDLMAGTKRVAAGELDYRLRVRTSDELGELAASFNKMTEDLARAQKEILDWNRTLEERVEAKTRELKQVYRNLVVSEKMASLGKLAATVAHEVNNPLFGILTYARLVIKELERNQLTPESRAKIIEQLRVIERESKRCGELMKTLLAYARQAPPQKRAEDLNVLARRALDLVRHQAELQGVGIIEKLSPDLPKCLCDGGQVQQVILALLVNALDAMPRGGQIEVVTETDGVGTAARIRVRDTGPGIPAGVLPHIFEPFFTTKEDQHRTGMGLAVARTLVEQHGGSITVDSSPEKGTEFQVLLPLGARTADREVGDGAKT